MRPQVVFRDPFRNPSPSTPFHHSTAYWSVERGPAAGSTSAGPTLETSLYSELLSLTAEAPLDHYFSNLHRWLLKFVKAPILIAGVKDVSRPEGFRTRYARDLTQPDALPSIDHAAIMRALRNGQVTLHASLPKLPTGGFLRQASESYGSVMIAPMHVEKRVVGYLAACNPSDGIFDERDVNTMACAAHHAALIVQNDISAEEAKARATEMHFTHETARLLGERDVVEYFRKFHGLVRGIMDADTFWAATGFWTDETIALCYCVKDNSFIASPLPVLSKGSMAGLVLREGMPIIAKTHTDFRHFPEVEQGSREDVNSAIVVPLISGSRITGVISAQSSKPNAYSVRERDILEVMAEQATIAVESGHERPTIEVAPALHEVRTCLSV